jgi:toxin HigB-1
MKLQQLNAAETLKDLSIPRSNQLEALKGNRKGEYSIRINKQWRICFKWREGHALDVEIVDRKPDEWWPGAEFNCRHASGCQRRSNSGRPRTAVAEGESDPWRIV